MGARRLVVLRVGPERLVEPLSLARWPRGVPLPAGGRVRPAAVGVRDVDVCGRVREPAHLYVLRAGNLASGGHRYAHEPTHRHRDAIHGVRCLEAKDGHAFFTAASPVLVTALVDLDLATGAFDVVKQSTSTITDRAYLSVPETLEFPTEDGLTAYAFFYAPKNGDTVAPEGEKPPLLVMSHGGPTAATSPTYSRHKQYWTSRGIAVLDVNYGGSTGYGRRYRERLDGQWGVVDVNDCINGARFLAERGLVDGNRLAITGESAGGYTALCALTFRAQFKAGASHFGIGDLEALVRDTHKFESRYLDRLIGPYPDHRDVYAERSPIHHADRLASPVIFFQGLDDKVVPPTQDESMVHVLRKKGVPVAYVSFEGEQHGFRRAANIKRAVDGEFYFYSRVFGFAPAEGLEPVEIDNL